MSMNAGRAGRISPAGVAVVVVVAAGIAAGGWAVWTTLRGSPSPAAAGSASAPVAPPAAYEVILRTANASERDGNLGAAETVLREGVAQFAQDQQLRLVYGRLLVRMERYADAYAQYEAALAIGPREAAVEHEAGTVASVLGEHRRAVEHFAAAQTKDPSKAVYALHLGAAQTRVGEVDAAQASLVRSTVLDPGSAAAWGALADLALRRNQGSLAVQHARKAREIEPDQPAWRLLEARGLKREGDAEGALGVLVALADAQRLEPEYTRTEAECLGLLGRTAEAADRYERAAQARPDDGPLAMEAALWAERAGRPERALALARRSLAAGHPPASGLVERLGGGG